MSGSDRQIKNPRTHGAMGGAVPVLFTLRNVQPRIVGNTPHSATPAVTEPTKDSGSAQAAVVAPAIPIAVPVPPSSVATKTSPATRSNRAYNILVGVLIIAICLIVIKNSTKNNGQKSVIASKSEAAPAVVSKASNPVGPVVPSSGPAMGGDLAAIDSKPPALKIPALPAANSTLANTESKTEGAPLQFPENPLSLKEPNAFEQRATEPISLAPTQPPMPMLLSSPKPDTFAAQIPSLPKADLQTNPSQPAAATRRNAEPQPTSYEPYVSPMDASPALATQAGASPILNTNSPLLETKQLMEIKLRGSNVNAPNPANLAQPQPAPFGAAGTATGPASVPATTVSHGDQGAAYVPNNFATHPSMVESGMLAGSAYPPPAKEYQPIAVRPYEQGAMSNLALPAANQNSQRIREPANISNRYPQQPNAGTVPYTPMTGNPPVSR